MIPAIVTMIASGGAASAGDAAGGASGNASSGGENNSQFAETFAAVRNTQSAPAEAEARASDAAPAAEETAAVPTEDSVVGKAVMTAMKFAKGALDARSGDRAGEGDALMAALGNPLDPDQASPEDDVPDLIGLLLSARGAVEVQAANNDNPAEAQDVPDEGADAPTEAAALSLLALLLNQAQPVQEGAEVLAGGEGDDLLVQDAQAAQNTSSVPQGGGIQAAEELLEALQNAVAASLEEPVARENGVAAAQASATSQEDAAKQLDALLAASQIKNVPVPADAKNIAPELTQEAVVPLRRPETQNNTGNNEPAVLPLPVEAEEKGGTVITDRLADFLKDLKLPQGKSDTAHKEAIATQTKAAATATQADASGAGAQTQTSNVVSLGALAAQPTTDSTVTPGGGDAARDKVLTPALQGDAPAQATTPPASEVKPQAPAPEVQFHKLVQAASVSQDKVVDQVKVQIQNMAQQGVDRINIQMQPPELGRVHVRLDISSEGHTTGITITASNQSTLDLLQRDSRDLAKALQGSGLSMEAGDMQFNLQQQNPQGGGFFGQNDNNNASATPFSLDANGEAATANDGVEVMAGEYLLTLAGGLDIRV